MFLKFFHTLREMGLHVTLGEFLTLQEALEKSLAFREEAVRLLKQAEAEAKKAEAEAMKEKQDYYQQMAEDLAKDRDYYKQDRDEQRDKLDKLSRSVIEWKRQTDDTIDELRRQVARNGRQIDAMRPLLCADLTCKKRKRVVISDDAETKPQEATAIVEPLKNDEL